LNLAPSRGKVAGEKRNVNEVVEVNYFNVVAKNFGPEVLEDWSDLAMPLITSLPWAWSLLD
jgi:hypothetical protein